MAAHRGLTIKQSRFIQELLIDGNQTAAAIRAGYSARSAMQTASELMRSPGVAAALSSLRAREAARFDIGRERVLTTLARIFFNPDNEPIETRDRIMAAGLVAKMMGWLDRDQPKPPRARPIIHMPAMGDQPIDGGTTVSMAELQRALSAQ